jgi:hypothetical protein
MNNAESGIGASDEPDHYSHQQQPANEPQVRSESPPICREESESPHA